MKKIALLLSLLTVVSATYAKDSIIQPEPVIVDKEIMDQPMELDKELVETPEPVIIETIAPVPILPWGYVEVRGGWDFWSKYQDKTGYVGKETNESGFELAVEAYKYWNYFDLGLGVAYQNHATRDAIGISPGVYGSGGEYDSVPIYLTGKYKLNYWNFPLETYFKANLGFSFNMNEKDISVTPNKYSTTIDDGLYWAAGIGFEYENFTMDFIYGHTQGKLDVKNTPTGNNKFDNDYQRVTVSLGYSFDIWY